MAESKKWYIYMIASQSGKLYTGITTEVERRYIQHQTGKGAKFFRMDPPKELLYVEASPNRSDASAREAEIKKMTREKKLKLALG